MKDNDILTEKLDAALAREAALRKELDNERGAVLCLQERLIAADERADLLEGLLREAIRIPYANDLVGRIEGALSLAEGERNHEIPGTSGMRLNMLANQGE